MPETVAPVADIEARGYAHPEVLVSTQWVADHLADPDVRIVESNEDVLLYETGHIPGAVKIDWVADLNDPLIRDYIDRPRFERLLRSKGISEDTTIVSLQNGLDSEIIARRALGNRGVVLRAITQFGAIFEAAGVIQFMARGYTLLEQHERSDRIAAVLTAAGLDCRVSPDIARDVWHKLLINCVVNPITAILGCEVRGIANPQLDPLKELVIAECIAVAATQGVVLEENFQEEISDFFRPSHNIASMLQDLGRGHTTEIDYLNGAVAALGVRQGVHCPVNAALTAIIKAMEAASLFPKKMLEPEPA